MVVDMATIDIDAITKDRERIKKEYLAPEGERPASSARGIHHAALLSSDVRRTVDFYQGLLEFPLTEIFENRDYAGSDHFFFDVRASTSAPTARSSAATTTSRSR
jgi:hypothetical protein